MDLGRRRLRGRCLAGSGQSRLARTAVTAALQICDGTGTVQFRYEKASNMPESYETRLRRLLPVSGNNENKDPERPVPEFQMPVRMIGTPTKTGEGLLFA
eukprot:Blabericola_migrator_1__10994@NODE_6375_length_547_cov_53_039583_g4329_i0_p1_GENE_NODE_6375_length_547_cov_53_039583_g4329_i0NODE_6375_length_547_cov_53_039583_g4329_i0_p1_ORF_typecomplete_len100_score9_25_NODE_6375_length_547_cov_53_039583_g4329_i0109408